MLAETKVPVIFQMPSQVPIFFNKGVKAWHRKLSHTPLSRLQQRYAALIPWIIMTVNKLKYLLHTLVDFGYLLSHYLYE